MIDYSIILSTCYPGSVWAINGNTYDGIEWLSDTPKPSQAELDALWPQVNYENQCNEVKMTRMREYEQQSDPLFFKWQRGDGTELEWREAVAKVKAENPYPAAP